jgi:cation transport ATPase
VTANIAFALAVKAVIFVLAAAGLATLWMAIAADVGASVAVILNGMRLRRMAGVRGSAFGVRSCHSNPTTSNTEHRA